MGSLHWLVLAAAGSGCLAVDLLWSRRSTASGLRSSLLATLLWSLAGVAFSGVVAAELGSAATSDYLTVFVLEKTLSLDNVAVFAAVMTALAVPATRAPRVLTVGLLGALVLRIGFIAAGLALVALVHPLLVGFGALLVVAGVRMVRSSGEPGHGESPAAVRRAPAALRRRPEMLALAAVVVADVAFAADSIMAAFAVTRMSYPIVAANVFAVLGLRPLYVVLTHALARLRYLPVGIGVLLAAIGIELMVEPWVSVASWVTLVVIAGCLGGAVVASLLDAAEASPRRVVRIAGVSVAGGGLLLAGAAMLVLPGPGLLVIVAGLAVLAKEFDWARRPLAWGRDRLASLRRGGRS